MLFDDQGPISSKKFIQYNSQIDNMILILIFKMLGKRSGRSQQKEKKKKAISAQIQQDYQLVFGNNNNIVCIEKPSNGIQNKVKRENLNKQSDKLQQQQQLDNLSYENRKITHKKEILLQLKIVQLQKLCHQLSEDNVKLCKKVSQLIDQKQSKISQTIFIDQFSQMNNDFSEIQILIKEYRSSLRDYEIKVKQQMKKKEEKFNQFTKELALLNEDYNILTDRLFEAQKLNQEYIYRLNNLQRQVKTNERFSYKQNRNKVLSHKYRHSGNTKQSKIDSEVEEELEELIQKLINELDYERQLKRKMQDQIKRLGRQLNNLQQEVKNKANIIYTLELNLLRYEKQQKNDIKEDTNKNREIRYKSQQTRALGRTNSLGALKSFTLAQLFANEVKVTNFQKMSLIPRLLEYYQRKKENRFYSQINPEDLLIFNYNSQHLNMVSIRQANRQRRIQSNTLPRMFWNMAFIIATLLNDVNSQNSKTKLEQLATKKLLDVLQEIVKTPQQEFDDSNIFFDELSQYIGEYFSKEVEKQKNK